MKQRLGTIWVIGRRELTTRARSKAFRISSVVLLVSLILGIVVPAFFLRGTDRYTVAVVSPAGGALAAAVASQAGAAGLTVTTREVADRATAVQLVEVGTAAAAVAPGEVVWKTNPDARLAPRSTPRSPGSPSRNGPVRSA
jgi:ABC-2 type transport system permease protein